ncbi:MAG: hypothetical protein D6820_00235 [Lentisphaerae bacterium]|nr:MAG: hypothetical protein D6820_00235 [Lentisphaerota bacterium]
MSWLTWKLSKEDAYLIRNLLEINAQVDPECARLRSELEEKMREKSGFSFESAPLEQIQHLAEVDGFGRLSLETCKRIQEAAKHGCLTWIAEKVIRSVMKDNEFVIFGPAWQERVP